MNVTILFSWGACFCLAPVWTAAAESTIVSGGVPHRAVGVNYFDAFTRTLSDPRRTNYDAGFAELGRRGVPFVRFCGGGFWPADWRLYQTNRIEYFRGLGAFVRAGGSQGIGLTPSFFWQYSPVPDLVGEPVNHWGDLNSRTHAFMREYTKEIVSRYQKNPTIRGWEFGNEYNLVADLPNAAQHRPPVAPSLGTPGKRSAEDELTHEQIRTALKAFAEEVRRHDLN